MYNWEKMFDMICKKYTGDMLKEKYGAYMEQFIHTLKSENVDLYNKLMLGLYVLIYGEHFNKELADKAVSNMINSDGTKGAHWTLEETTSMAKNEGITFQHFNEYDWFYVINMIYSDFYKVFGSNTNMYVKTALEWLTDADVKAGKAYRYYVNVVDVA